MSDVGQGVDWDDVGDGDGGSRGRELEGREAVSAILEALADPRTRDILDLLVSSDGPLPVDAIANDLGIPTSTAYRKLNRVSQTPLVAKQIALGEDGHQHSEYAILVNRLRVDVDDEFAVTCEDASLDR